MRKIKYLTLLMILSLVFVACSNGQDSEKAKYDPEKKITAETISAKEYKNIDQAGFYINNKGKLLTKDQVKDYKIVEWYYDPVCPSCKELKEKSKDILFDAIGDKTVIKYQPLSFLGRPRDASPDYISYSDTIQGIILSMAEKDPDLVYQYMSKVINDQFEQDMQKLTTKQDQDNKLKDAYEKDLQGKHWDEIMAGVDDAIVTVKNFTKFTANNEELKKKTFDGNIQVPLLYVQGSDKALDVYDVNQDIEKLFRSEFK